MCYDTILNILCTVFIHTCYCWDVLFFTRVMIYCVYVAYPGHKHSYTDGQITREHMRVYVTFLWHAMCIIVHTHMCCDFIYMCARIQGLRKWINYTCMYRQIYTSGVARYIDLGTYAGTSGCLICTLCTNSCVERTRENYMFAYICTNIKGGYANVCTYQHIITKSILYLSVECVKPVSTNTLIGIKPNSLTTHVNVRPQT